MHCHCHTKQLYCGFGFFDYVIKDIVLCMFASTWIKIVLEQSTELYTTSSQRSLKAKIFRKSFAIISSESLKPGIRLDSPLDYYAFGNILSACETINYKNRWQEQ